VSIAACHFSSEGVVLGADSTSSVASPVGEQRRFDYSQKVFEVGENGTLGVCTWGLGRIGSLSHRQLIAELSQSLWTEPVTSVAEAAERLSSLCWDKYRQEYSGQLMRAADLSRRSRLSEPDEQDLLLFKAGLTLGYCIGGTWNKNPKPEAYEVLFNPASGHEKPKPAALQIDRTRFWGAPHFFNRLIEGIDPLLRERMLTSGKWNGTPAELDDMIRGMRLVQPVHLPLREAVDWIHTVIQTTIKSMKFSQFPQVCGGPVEIAVVTADRRFRWVKHKRLDDAIT
jgi:hypothetical protein